MNVLDQLKAGRDFTATEETLAAYLLQHPDEAADLTIGELAARTHCSNSSIVRLCRKLGLDGFREFRVELARQLERGRVSSTNVDLDRPFDSETITADRASALATLTKRAVDDTYASVSLPMVREAARIILGARRLAYYATGDTYATMEGFASYLLKCGIMCAYGLARGEYGVASSMLGPRDAAIIVSYSGTIADNYRSVFETLRANRCKLILISANPEMRERFLGYDCAIMLPAGETRLEHVATFYSQTCIRYALNLIYAEVFSEHYHENLDRWQGIEQGYEQMRAM